LQGFPYPRYSVITNPPTKGNTLHNEITYTPETIDIPKGDRRVMATTVANRLGSGIPEWGDMHPYNSRGCKNLITRAERYVAEGRKVEAHAWTDLVGNVSEMYVVTVSEQDDVERQILLYVDSNENRMSAFDEYYADHYWGERAIKEAV
jgi:hypothetical protein